MQTSMIGVVRYGGRRGRAFLCRHRDASGRPDLRVITACDGRDASSVDGARHFPPRATHHDRYRPALLAFQARGSTARMHSVMPTNLRGRQGEATTHAGVHVFRQPLQCSHRCRWRCSLLRIRLQLIGGNAVADTIRHFRKLRIAAGQSTNRKAGLARQLMRIDAARECSGSCRRVARIGG